jgi:hypothetical protein
MTEAGTVTPKLAVTMIRCEVGDADRFGYIHGQWWKLEGPAHDNHKPVASTETSSFTLTEAEDTEGWQRLLAKFPREDR